MEGKMRKDKDAPILDFQSFLKGIFWLPVMRNCIFFSTLIPLANISNLIFIESYTEKCFITLAFLKAHSHIIDFFLEKSNIPGSMW